MEFRGSEGSVLTWKTILGGGQSTIQFEDPELEMPERFAADNEKHTSGFQREHEG